MAENRNVMDMMEANAVTHRGKGTPSLKHIEVVHHMTNGESHSELVQPHEMSGHMADCVHCGGGDKDSAAGAAT